MNKNKIRNSIFASAMSMVLLLNFLMPNMSKAQSIAYADQVANSETSKPGDTQLQMHTTVIVVVFIVVATIKGLHLTDDAQTNINNLD